VLLSAHFDCAREVRSVEREVVVKYVSMTIVVALVFLTVNCLFGQSPVWLYEYNDPDSGDDAGYAIVQGEDGNLYVSGLTTSMATGSDLFVTSLYAPGDTNWTFAVSGTGWWELAEDIAYGGDGNIYAAGGVSDGMMVVSLTTAGDSNWTYQLQGSAGEGSAEAITYGEDGNIYVAGGIRETSSGYDFIVVSLSGSGAGRWVYQYQGAGNWWDRAYDLVYGSDGNIYAAGYSNEVAFDPRWFVVSLDTAGNERWTWDSYMPGSDCNSIFYGSDDNLYICGRGGTGLAVVSIDTGGSYRWEYVLAGTSGYGTSIIQGSDGRLYATGQGSHTEGSTIVAVCLDTAGSEQWVFKYDTTAVRGERADAIVYGPDGNLYIGGAVSDTSYLEADFIVLSVDTLGVERWAWRYEKDEMQDWCEAMCVGVDGNIYATGRVNDSLTSTDMITVCFDVLPPSVPQLIYPPDDTVLTDTMVAFEWHPSVDPGSGIDHYVHQYDTDSLFSGPTTAMPQDTFLAAVMPDTGTYYWRVHAVDHGSNHGADSGVWSFRVSLVGIEESPARLRRATFSVQGNPVLGQVSFRLSLPEASHTDLRIYDVAGRMVDAPLKGKISAGVYFYRLESEHLTRTGKLVVF
jgi:hypothetical protein